MQRMSDPNGDFFRGRIVVGVDGSTSSVHALQWARRVGEALGLGLDVVTCWDYPTSYGLAGGSDAYRPDLDAVKLRDEAISTAFPDGRPIDLRTTALQGHPAQVLKDASTDAEMLVLGSRGHGGFAGLLLGSVSASCAEYASCPVVVVHD